MKETSAAYIAGFLDGEGTITLIKSHRTSYQTKLGIIKKPDYFYLCPRLYVGANTDKNVLDWCHQELNAGGIVKKHPEIGNWRSHYTLLVTKTQHILLILSELTPFLKVKKKHAQIMMEFLQSRLSRREEIVQDPKTGRIIGFIGKPYTKRELEIYEEIHRLNLKGVKSWA